MTQGPELIASNSLQDLNAALEQIRKQLQQIGRGEYLVTFEQDEKPVQSNLAESFVASIKKATKPGLKLE